MSIKGVLQGGGPAALALLSLFVGGCGGAREDSPDLLLVTIGSVRKDFLGCYGYSGQFDENRHVTPSIDRLAAEGMMFDRHYTTSVFAGPAHSSLMTGLHPIEHGVLDNDHRLESGPRVLAEALRAAGYKTAAVISDRALGETQGYARGFDSFDEPEGTSERPANEAIDAALEVLTGRSERPLFLWVHLNDPNHPYRAPEDVPRLDRREIYNMLPVANDQRRVAADLGTMYAAELRHADRELGRLLAAWDDSTGPDVVALTSDHGEGLMEHGYAKHGLLLFEEQVVIPLILRGEGCLPGTVVGDVTSMADLSATLLELCDVPAEGVAGYSLLNRPTPTRFSFFERPDATGNDAMIERIGCGHAGQYGLVEARYKALLSEEIGFQLYDLRDDPDENIDISDWRTEVAAELRARMEQWRDSPRRAADEDGADAGD